MPVQPDIALGAKGVELPNPLLMAMHGAMLRNQTMQGNALMQGINANQATSEAIKGAINPDTGEVDYQGAMRTMAQDPRAAYNLPQFAQGVNAMTLQKLGIDREKLKLMQERYDSGVKQISALIADPKLNEIKVVGGLASWAKNFQIPADGIAQVFSGYPDNPNDPEQLRSWLRQKLISSQDHAKQLDVMTKVLQQVDNGQQKQFWNVNPNAGEIGPVGAQVQKQLPPETGVFNTDRNAKGYLGPQPAVAPAQGAPAPSAAGTEPIVKGLGNEPPIEGAPLDQHQLPDLTITPRAQSGQTPKPAAAKTAAAPATGKPAPFVQSDPALGKAEAVAGTVNTMNDHWKGISNDASVASTVEGVAQNVKSYAHNAVTGSLQARKAMLNGLLSLLPGGIGKATGDIKTDTDLLEKNMARLTLNGSLGGSGTDALRTLAAAANPHSGMSETAIKEAADQVIGQVRMAKSAQQLLQPFKLANDEAGYTKTLTQFNKYADPRVWQFESMDAPSRKAFLAKMGDTDRAAFRAKITGLESMGLFK